MNHGRMKVLRDSVFCSDPKWLRVRIFQLITGKSEEHVVMRSTKLVCLTFVSVVLCGCHNVIPIWPIEISPPATDADAQRIDDVIQAQGFVRTNPHYPPVVGIGTQNTGTTMGEWFWPTHKSTYVTYFKMTGTNNYRVFFVDTDTDGSQLLGLPCGKYLEFVSALKARFGAEHPRLKFYRETCDPQL